MDYNAICKAIDAVEFDGVFTIDAGGMVTEVFTEYAPSVYHDDHTDVVIDGAGWFTVSDGMSGQDRYSGPVLHASEVWSPGMVERIMYSHDAGTLFAFTVVEDLDHPDSPVGWAVVGKYAR